MQIPIPPTDNLYKFIAISGTIILVLSYLVPIYFELKLSPKMAENMGDIVSVEYELDILENIDEEKSGYADRVDKVVQLHKQTKKKHIINKSLYADLERLASLRIAGLIIGFTFMVIGYFLWFFRIQRYLDQELRKISSE